MLQSMRNRSMPDDKTMTLAEARGVMWLRNNYRSMGELFDEGFLDRGRLEWAIEKAYDSRIRQAAQVLLGWQNRPLASSARETRRTVFESSNLAFTVSMSLEQARAIRWPFRPYQNQPIGALLDTKQLSLKDLVYAVENAWDERVRRAATTLTLVRLEQVIQEPESSAGFLRVISGGRSYAERKQLVLNFIQGSLIGGLLGATVMYIILYFLHRSSPIESSRSVSEILASPYGSTVIIIAIVLMLVIFTVMVLSMFLFNKLILRLEKQITSFRKGKEGEDRVVAVISQSLDGNWHLFRNVVLPGRNRADLDGVLVGPLGIWMVEIKTYTHEYRCVGDRWEYRAGNQWRTARKNPSHQAKNNAAQLSNFLRADGIQQWVNPVVVWANPESRLSLENPEVPIWTLDRLPDELGNMWNDKGIDESTRRQIVNKLTKLCQRQERTTESE